MKAHGAGFAIMPNTITVTHESDGFVLDVEALHLRGVWRKLDDTHILAVATNGFVPRTAVCGSGADLKAAIDPTANPEERRRSGDGIIAYRCRDPCHRCSKCTLCSCWLLNSEIGRNENCTGRRKTGASVK